MSYLINYTLYRETGSNEHYFVVIADSYEQARDKFSKALGEGGYINSVSLVSLIDVRES